MAGIKVLHLSDGIQRDSFRSLYNYYFITFLVLQLTWSEKLQAEFHDLFFEKRNSLCDEKLVSVFGSVDLGYANIMFRNFCINAEAN